MLIIWDKRSYDLDMSKMIRKSFSLRPAILIRKWNGFLIKHKSTLPRIHSGNSEVQYTGFKNCFHSPWFMKLNSPNSQNSAEVWEKQRWTRLLLRQEYFLIPLTLKAKIFYKSHFWKPAKKSHFLFSKSGLLSEFLRNPTSQKPT